MTFARGLSLTLALLACAGLVEAREPTPQETQQWDRAKALHEEVEDQLRTYIMRAEQDNNDYELTPFYTADGYTGSYERATSTMVESFKLLAELDAKLGPLREALAAIETSFGNTPAAIETKCWAEFGKVIDPRQPGFSRRLSPDRSKWLDTETNYPFTFYANAKKAAGVSKLWGDKVSEVTCKKIDEAIQQHARSYADHTVVYAERKIVGDLEKIQTAVKAILPFRAGDTALAEASAKLDAAVVEWQAKADALIDKYRLKPDGAVSNADEVAEAAAAYLSGSYAQQYVKGEVLSVRVTSDDWESAGKNILGTTIQWQVWLEVAVTTPEEREKDIARVIEMKIFTKEELDVAKGPPFDDFSTNSTWLMRASNVEGRGGGFFATLFKLVLGFGCCVLFLGVVGGGGYMAYKQMNAQKAAAAAAPAAPGAAPAPPAPGAPPAPPG